MRPTRLLFAMLLLFAVGCRDGSGDEVLACGFDFTCADGFICTDGACVQPDILDTSAAPADAPLSTDVPADPSRVDDTSM